MFSISLYKERRLRLRERVRTGLIVLPGNDLLAMNYRANTYPFRQDASFSYFVGIQKPDLCLIMDCDSGSEWLVGTPCSMSDTIWSGPTLSLKEMGSSSGIDRVLTWSAARDKCQNALAAKRELHYLPRYQGDQILKLAGLLAMSALEIEKRPSQALIHSIVALRSVKDEYEIAEIRQAIALSAEVYSLLMRSCRPDLSEMELCGRLQGLVLSRGSQEAFPTILSVRGEVLHNHLHDGIMNDGDLLLVDSGVLSVNCYASDITRTIPVSGRFTSKQKEIYAIVLKALQEGTRSIAPGIPYRESHLVAARTIVTGLCELGIMQGDPGEAVAAGAHALFFPHGLGHMLGLDVHDMESLGEDFVGYDQSITRAEQFGLSGLRMGRALEDGFVITVEPGIYFIPDLIRNWQTERRFEQFINYKRVMKYLDFGGIRLEDDVLVTSVGHDVLSIQIPKNMQAVEASMER